MPFLNNLGPLEAVIIGVGCLATVAVPIGLMFAVVYLSKRRLPGPPGA